MSNKAAVQTITPTDDSTANADQIGTLLDKLAGNDQERRMAEALKSLLTAPAAIAALMDEGEELHASDAAVKLTAHLEALLRCMETARPADLYLIGDAHGNTGYKVRPVGLDFAGEIWAQNDGTFLVYAYVGREVELLGRADSLDSACSLGGWTQT